MKVTIIVSPRNLHNDYHELQTRSTKFLKEVVALCKQYDMLIKDANLTGEFT